MNFTTKRFLAFILLVCLTSIPLCAKEKAESTPVLPDVTARGRLLYEYDEAAWHASDAVQTANHSKEGLGTYIAQKTASGWTVVFGRLNDKRDAFLIRFVAVQGREAGQFSVKEMDPPQADRTFYLVAALAIETALQDFRGEDRPYNVAVLPANSDRLYVYVVPAQTNPDIYPLGGDVRYLITADGSAIVEKRQLHKTILEIPQSSLPKGTKPAVGYHTHVLSEVPEDTDVFHVLTRKPPQPEAIGTPEGKIYEIVLDGTIYYLGKQ